LDLRRAWWTAHAVRIRPSGALWFIDLHVMMNGSCTLNEAHAATEAIEQAILWRSSPRPT